MKYIKMIFISAITFLSILGTTSFASVTMTEEQADQILDYFAENCAVYINGTSDKDINTTKSIFSNVNRETFTNTFNSDFVTKIGITDEYDWSNITILGGSYDKSHYAMLYFFVSNCSASDTLNYLKINKSSSGYTIGYWEPETQQNASKLNLFSMQIRNSSTITTSGTTTYPTITYIASNNIIDDGIKVTVPSFLGCAPAQVIYYNNGTEVVSRFLNDYIKLTPDIDIPDEPESGDTSGDTGGGGGSTTTPDYTQDLDDIKNEVGNINDNLNKVEEAIPTSGEIAGATEQGNKDFWGNKDEMSEDDYENEIQQGIDNSMEQITGELEQNEVFSSIAIAEQKIIDLFLEEPEDFIISWQDVNYLERTLIPAGEVNFSQICRDNEALGRVKTTLNIIVSAMISLSLFKYIFNLIMVTLGIDHPLILEGEKDDITEISSTKIGNKTYVTKKTYKSNKKGGR